MMDDWIVVAESTRGNLVENQHFGIATIVDSNGRVLKRWGDSRRCVFGRSALKPFQALPISDSGVFSRLGLTEQDLALMCASHSGAVEHASGVKRILHTVGLTSVFLKCGCQIPLGVLERIEEGSQPLSAYSPLQHNCSGKHAGFLAASQHFGFSLPNYLEVDHPIQRLVKSAISRALETRETSLVTGIDGCSAPTYAIPLEKLAFGYARLAAANVGDPLRVIGDAMIAHPNMVSGKGRGDAFLARAHIGNIVSKFGADGIQCLGIRGAGIGVAIKVSDGNTKIATAIGVRILERLGFGDIRNETDYSQWAAPMLRNSCGSVVGETRICL